MFCREDGDAALGIATTNRGANSAGTSRKRRVRPGNRKVNLVMFRFDGNRMGIDCGGRGGCNRLVFPLSEGVNYAKQLIGAKRR